MRLLAAIGAILIVVTLVGDGQSQSAPHGRAAISGRVVDQFGDPVVRAHVVVEVRTGLNATQTVATAEADDRGEYRIGRLPAGSYVVAVLRIDTLVVTPEVIVMAGPARTPQKTYYLGAQDLGEAETLHLEADETHDRIDFVPSRRPSGIATGRRRPRAAGCSSGRSTAVAGRLGDSSWTRDDS